MYHAARTLKEKGHSLTFACLNTKKHFQDPAFLEHLGKVHSVEIDTSISFFGLIGGLFSSMPYNVQRFFSPEFAAMLEKLISENDFDIIQLEGSYLAIYKDALKNIKKATLMLRSHNVEAEIWKKYAFAEKNPLKRFYLNNLSKKILNFEKESLSIFDAVMTISSSDEKFYRESGFKGKLRTVNAGVDTKVALTGIKAIADSVCFLGSLEWLPNIEGLKWFLSDVWPLVLKEIPRAEFHFAGKNHPREIEKISGQGVFFHGMVPDANSFISGYSIVVIPLLSGSGMRLKAVEAMAAAKPVVSTSLGMEGLSAIHGTHFLEANSANDFAKSILRLLRNENERIALSTEGRKLAVARYDWSSLAEEMEKFYGEVL